MLFICAGVRPTLNRRRLLLVACVGSLAFMGGGLFAALFHPEIAAVHAQAPDGTSAPIFLRGGQTYRIALEGDSPCTVQEPVQAQLVDAEGGAVVWSGQAVFQKERQGCRTFADFGELTLPNDGAYRLHWSISQGLVRENPRFYVRSSIVPEPVGVAAFSLGLLVFAGVSLRYLRHPVPPPSGRPEPPAPPKGLRRPCRAWWRAVS